MGSTVTGEGMTLGLGCGMGDPTSIGFRIGPVPGATIKAHRYRAVPNSRPLNPLDISLIALGIEWETPFWQREAKDHAPAYACDPL